MSEKKEAGWVVLIIFVGIVVFIFGLVAGYELGKESCQECKTCEICQECPVVVERNCIKEKNCIEDCLDFIYYGEGLK